MRPINEGWTLIYRGDALVFSRRVHENLQRRRKALQLLREKECCFKAHKYPFYVQTICILGIRISAAGLLLNPAKIEGMWTWCLALYTCTDLQKFLGLASYCRNAIPGFAIRAAPFRDLLQTKGHNPHGSGRNGGLHAFDCFTSFAVVALPDFNKPFFPTTAATDATGGVMLSRLTHNPQKHQIIARCSHCSTLREQRHPVSGSPTLCGGV